MSVDLDNANRFRSIFEVSYQFMSILDMAGTVIQVNQSVSHFCGKDKTELTGEKYWDRNWWVGGTAEREEIRTLVAQAAAGQAGHFQAEVRGANDQLAVVDFSIKPITDDSGNIVEILTEGHDITEIALSNARHQRVLERRLQESEAMAAVSQALSSTLEPQGIMNLIVETANNIVPNSDWAIIHLLQGRPELLVPAATAGEDINLSDYIIAPNEGAAGLALEQGQLIHVGDTQNDPRPSAYAHMIGLRSLLVAPVQTKNRRLGTITLHCRHPYAFTEINERLLSILASQAGLAIENAALFDSQRRARLVAELQRKRLRTLAERLVSVQEEERLRISRELHDEAGQALTSLKISLDLLQKGLPPDQEPIRARLADLSQLTGATMDSLRTLAHDLRPPGLDSFGLDVALAGLCHDFGHRTGLLINYTRVDLPELPMALSLSMYRFAQEALTNIAKHAEARSVEVEVGFAENVLTLSITDDGRGFTYDPDEAQPGVGLVSMQERAVQLGGVLDIHTAPGQGTRLTARVPYEIPISLSESDE